MAVAAEAWLRLMRAEYIESFIANGGAAVKFIVGEDDDGLAQVADRLAAVAGELGMLHVPLDAADTRLHMIQDVFFAISRRVDWDGVAQRRVEAMFHRQGYEWPRPGEAMSIHQVAEANRVDVTLLRRDFRQWLTGEVMQDNRLAQDFRVAMTQLCLRRLAPPESAAVAVVDPVIEWLRGELRAIGTVRQHQINAKITRNNARAMLRSLCCWIHRGGVPGIVLVLDIRQLARTGAAVGSGLKYSAVAVIDAFEVLRQLIDDAERFDGLFVAALADETLIGEDPKRSLRAYDALRFRVWSDVHARGRDNPLAPLIRLATDAGRSAEAP